MSEGRSRSREWARLAARIEGTLALLACLAPGLSGCGLFRGSPPVTPEIVVPDTVAATADTVVTPPRETPSPVRRTPARPAPATPAPTDTVTVRETAPPERLPSVTVRLSPRDRAARLDQFHGDVGRAEKALAAVRGRVLTMGQEEQLAAADRFLADAHEAFRTEDLARACAVAEKARILAEELRAQVAPP